ncbi:MAG TPA: S9 family peptidase [Tepidisphaeraceae bacterium]|jgi:oligopeptidase B|nr:S9 family peptidase [Tepidisphaeraceae bacterium]
MTQTSIKTLALTILSLTLGCAHELQPPVAKRIPQTVTIGNQKVVDNYWWLRKKDNPAVTQYLQAENAYTDARMKPTANLQEKLYTEMVARIHETDEDVPHRDGDWWYSTRTEQGKQYPIYLRRHGGPNVRPQIINDANILAAGHNFFDYEPGDVSDDGNLLAYATDTTGNRQYLLQIKDLQNNVLLPDSIPQVDSFVWSADNHVLYYVKEDESKRGKWIYRHQLGSSKDQMVYEEKDEEFSLGLGRTRDKKFLVIVSESKTETEAQVRPADESGKWRVILPRKKNLQYYIDHAPGKFYLRINDTNQNFRIVTTPENHLGKKSWTELVPTRSDVVLQDMDVFAHDLVLTERRNGIPQIAIAKLDNLSPPPFSGGPQGRARLTPKEIDFDEPDYLVEPLDNDEFDPPTLRIAYQSLTTPGRVIDIDLQTGEQKIMKQRYVGGGFKRENYREERLLAPAADGTLIPISLVYRVGLGGKNTHAKLLLDGYGSYGIPEDVYFSSARLSLLDRGVSFAIAHIRGGGEFGRAWYDAGRMQNKPNTFSDFIASAEYLQSQGYTSRNSLAIQGGSAGGLLIGAVLNQRPNLFHEAIAEVPWVDVLADMSDPSIPLTTLEYTEWGNPNVPAERAVIASYDPIENVRAQSYPHLLVRESLNDSQVQYWDAARWVAKLRATKTGTSELLLKMDMDAGHSGASGRYTELRDAAFDDAWLLTRFDQKP